MRVLTALTILLASLALLAGPAYAQAEEEARLGGGSDIPAEVTIRLPQGGSLPPVHVMFADNPSDQPIEVEFRAEAPVGIEVDPEWEKKLIPAEGSVVNPFSVRVVPGAAPGEYPVVVQLVRSDIESVPGRITSIPAIQTVFTVEVTGEAAAVTVRPVSAHTGAPLAATITLSARDGDRRWFEIDRTEATTLETQVAPGEFRAAVLLGEREVAAEEFTVGAGQNLDVVIEVETVSFVVAAVRPVEERGRLVVAELVASVNNETDPLPGPGRLQATVFHDEVEVDNVILEELSEVPAGITEATATYRPESGWTEGSYSFLFELVTPAFILASPDQPVLDVPAMGLDVLAFLAGLDIREAIALAAVVLLGLAMIAWLIVVMFERRRSETAPTKKRHSPWADIHLGWRLRRKNDIPPPSGSSWLEERIGPTTAERSGGDDDNGDVATRSVPSVPSPRSDANDNPVRVSESPPAANQQAIPNREVTSPRPPRAHGAATPGDSPDMAQMAGALRVVQKLHDRGSLGPGWSVTDATLIYWAMISPRMRETLRSVGMSHEDYVSAMRRLFTEGLLGRRGLPRDTENLDGAHDSA